MIRSHVVHIFHVKKRSVVSKFIDQNHTLISKGCSPVDSREKKLDWLYSLQFIATKPKRLTCTISNDKRLLPSLGV